MLDLPPRDDRFWTWVALGAVLAGAAVRLWDLDGKSLWFDEALSLDDSRSLAERFGSGFHPPIYYWVLHAWTAVFGDSPTAARLTAAIPGALTPAVVFAAGRRMFTARAGALGAWVLALSSLHV